MKAWMTLTQASRHWKIAYATFAAAWVGGHFYSVGYSGKARTFAAQDLARWVKRYRLRHPVVLPAGDLMSISEAAQTHRCSTSRIYYAVRRGELIVRGVGPPFAGARPCQLLERSDVEAWIATQTRAIPPPSTSRSQ